MFRWQYTEPVLATSLYSETLSRSRESHLEFFQVKN